MKSIDLSGFAKPASLSLAELQAKLAHMGSVLDDVKAEGVLLRQEGALRWLTGIRHQIGDIAPDANSPVQALARRRGSGWELRFVTTRFEMPRVRDQVPQVFEGADGVSVVLSEDLPALPAGVLVPGHPAYAETVGRIVRPLVGGPQGDQVRKLEWLVRMSAAVLAETAYRLEPGMDGASARGLLFEALARRDIECNLILVALGGQEGHFHPLYEARYRIGRDSWVKLVVGARYADLIVSQTVMVKFGGVLETARAAYRALQEAAVEYADCYRAGALEADIHTAIGERFRDVARRRGIPEIGRSAYAHHLGGPTSPLGNRDYLITEGGTRRMFPWMQFAVNPAEVLNATKVEIQGFVRPDGPPVVPDASGFLPSGVQGFTRVAAAGGTTAMVPDIVER